MTKIYPETILKNSLPKNFFEQNLLTKDLTLKKRAMQALILATTLSKRDINKSVNKVVEIYENKIDELRDDGLPKVKASVLAVAGENLLKQRIAGIVVFDEVQQIKEENQGEKYRWLPSSSENPDPQHQLLYGKIFNVGEGDEDGNMPMERWGCNCGIEILSNKKK
jgi:hypothetical protein